MWSGSVVSSVDQVRQPASWARCVPGQVAGAGAGGIDVAQATLTGQSALAVAWGQRPRLITDRQEDYEFRPATAIEELIGIKKTSFQGKMYGALPIFTAAVPNA